MIKVGNGWHGTDAYVPMCLCAYMPVPVSAALVRRRVIMGGISGQLDASRHCGTRVRGFLKPAGGNWGQWRGRRTKAADCFSYRVTIAASVAQENVESTDSLAGGQREYSGLQIVGGTQRVLEPTSGIFADFCVAVHCVLPVELHQQGLRFRVVADCDNIAAGRGTENRKGHMRIIPYTGTGNQSLYEPGIPDSAP